MGTAYVVNWASGTVTPIDIATNTAGPENFGSVTILDVLSAPAATCPLTGLISPVPTGLFNRAPTRLFVSLRPASPPPRGLTELHRQRP
ncbi:MAG: hypothetical protein ABSA53_32525 [Streptosporangiaceae bacterium]|jgi:hypothetical protein